ncbi:pyridoxamine 5'-phosphate oxidase [Dyadobacter sandarakinus]|uniref:Pyridoxine/pyridoxamine 5'-phosphate oxidase n=1 Tax=Dyadobacter sandarakinus TaxID=2747268 RepID=A0ABX7I580_9BACT|nr:pyridoxamine 5'-phosphate oxidase [Dyadobacter sandarakinus]QRR00883.1 pyridoxamine 5'-phosphate oxidase [Dyadobacter sandarakinus]
MDYNIAKIRQDYNLNGLREEDLNPDPLKQFSIWFNEVLKAGISEPNAMVLSTVAGGRPSARVVLLKDLNESGFTFFTNYDSKKGRELAGNPEVALTFFWKELERQVRVEGRVEKTSPEESSDYFASRPRGSQLGAWVSRQSSVIGGREALEEAGAETSREFEGRDVPRPPHWGGYRVIPDYMEFWQGRPSRLHDRLVYTLGADGLWKIERLSP